MKRRDFRYLDRQRVRAAEIDAQGGVFNAHYLAYVDSAVAGYWRASALPPAQTMAAIGGRLDVRKATLEFESPARYDDVLDVGVRCTRVAQTSVTFGAAIFRGDTLLVSCELVLDLTAIATGLPLILPHELREALQGFEAGRNMVEVKVGSWDELGRDAGAIRTAVFVEEQQIPAEMEWDDADQGCLHAVAYNRFGAPLATGRLLEHVPGVAKIGRMAVAQAMRGSRVGRAVLDALMKTARDRGDREAVLHAQVSAAPFYARAGFVPRGGEFDEAGIPHIEMVRVL